MIYIIQISKKKSKRTVETQTSCRYTSVYLDRYVAVLASIL